MTGNYLPPEQIAELGPGSTVIFESWRSAWSGTEMLGGKVVKLTPKQVVVHYAGHNGTVEVRFRREDGQRVGEYRGQLLDPSHPLTQTKLAEKQRQRRRQEIDRLADRWARERDNLDLLRQLHVAVSEYLDVEQ